MSYNIGMILERNFYQKNTLKVAQSLLGCVLIMNVAPVKSSTSRGAKQFNGVKKTIKAMITETEAYMGEDDLASHASKGQTPRTELMYGEAGHAYIYMIYGMYHCLNIVTEKKNFPAAVLIRAVKIEGVDYKKTNGPGKLCKFLEIDRKLNGSDITHAPKQSLVRGKPQENKLWIERGIKIKPYQIKKDKRIGIDYAKDCKEYLWRFALNAEKTKRKSLNE